MTAGRRDCLVLIGSLVVLLFTIPLVTHAEVNEESHILISSDNILYEYTMDGSFVQQVTIPETIGCCGTSRDLAVRNDRSVSVYNGTFDPVLSMYNVENREWRETTADGWSTANNVSYGGIASDGSMVFVSDMSTSSEGSPNGIIRFDVDDDSWERFFSGQDYIDVSMGLDNKLYALRNVYGDLDVLDPQSMQLLYSLDLGHTSGVRGVAVKADGTIFAASWDGNIYRCDSAAQLLDNYATGMGNLVDIDINESGTLIVGARSGDIAVTDDVFSFFTIIDLNDSYKGAFVAFGELPLAVEFTPGNILVSNDHMLYEFTTTGSLIQQLKSPKSPECCGLSRDVVVTDSGITALYNGTFSPILSLYEDDSGQWLEMTADGWSTANNVSYGGITSGGSTVFVSDMSTAGEGSPNGIIRFDVDDDSWERFFSGQDYIDVSMGLDNKLYALRNVYGDLDVIDPQSMQLLYSLDLGHTSGVRGVAVKADGTIFAAGWDGNIYRYDSAAQLLGNYATGMGNLVDIDINESSTLIVGARSGEIAVTDDTFSFFTVIDVMDTGPSFVSHIPSSKEPVEISPWKDNYTGNLVTDIPWHYAMGYHFTPLVSGVVTKLGGFFDGTKTVRLFDKNTGELLSEATVTADNDWSFKDIPPISVAEGTAYTVAVYLSGSGGSYRWGIDSFPQEYQNIRIEGTTYAYTGIDPASRPTNTNLSYMFGQADVVFVPAE